MLTANSQGLTQQTAPHQVCVCWLSETAYLQLIQVEVGAAHRVIKAREHIGRVLGLNLPVQPAGQRQCQEC